MTPPLLSALLAAAVALPGGTPVHMDYLAYDAATNRIWVPAGNTGNVDVVDVATGKVSVIGGLPTAPAARPGRPPVGPSSAAAGDGVVWVGNRADDRLTAYDARTLAPRASVRLPTMPDGVQFVRRTRELWVTTPGARAITIVELGGKAPGAPEALPVGGEPEGLAVDEARGVFYTNLEDADETLAIDVASRKVVGRWAARCGAAGPRGLELDGARRWLFVACTDGARVADLASGKPLGRLDTGGGVDNLAYDPARRALFIASSHEATLVVARVADDGRLREARRLPTAKGARNPVLDARGTAYVEDATGGRLLVLPPEGAAAP